MKKRSFWNIVLLIALDSILILFSFYLAYWIRFNLLIETMPGTVPVELEYIRMALFALLIWMIGFRFFNVYEKRFAVLIDEIALIFVALSFSSALFLGLLYLYKEFWFSRQVLLYVWFFSFLFLLFLRIIFYSIQRFLFEKGIGVKNALIFGAGDIGLSLAAKIVKGPGLGYRLVGFIDDDPVKEGKRYLDVPVLGASNYIKDIIESKRIDVVIVAVSNPSSEQVLDIITECEILGVEFKIVPGLLEILASRVDIDEVGGIPLVTIEEVKWQGLKAYVKRSADILFSLLLLVLLLPFFLLITILIKLDSPGPLFFYQERVGKEGAVFKMLKFRSMFQNAEELLPDLRRFSEVEGHVFKIKDDPRMTRVGKWIRRYSIDEFPQLVNVFIGQMSLVGPRPPLPREVKDYSRWHLKRLRIAPGITGLWQVSGRSELPFEDMVRLDIYYIENWSLWMDIKILFRTIPAVINASGAY